MRTSLIRLFFLTFVFLGRQSSAGPVSGQIVDPNARAVPAAEILLVSADRGSVIARAVTDSDGHFAIAAPDAGSFEIRVAREGFRAKPVAVTGTSSSIDVGTVSLEVSAVSESVVVSAAQVEIPLSATSSSITVISRDDLERHQVETVADALRTVPGLSVASTGGRGAQTSVFPRGGESDYSLVFIDGIQANAFGGGFDFAHLPVANIERIEIVRGPQSALYGSNAIGSVIRVITRRGGTPEGSASIEGGSFGTFRFSAASSGSVGPWQWGASAERLSTDGQNGRTSAGGALIENDDYDRTLASVSGGWRHRSALVRGDVRYSRDERGSPGPFGSDPGGTYSGIDKISHGTNDRWLSSIGGSFAVKRTHVNAETTHSKIDGDFVSPFSTSDSSSRRNTARVQADTTLAHGLDTSAGVEWLNEEARSTFIRATGGLPVPVERGQTGFFAEGRWNRAARLFVAAGIRAERITRKALPGEIGQFSTRPPFDDDTTVSANPKISVAWYVHSVDGMFTKVRGAVGTGIRPPDAFEIAFTDNPSLKSERSRSGEIGIDQSFSRGRGLIEATTFFNNYDDLIVTTGSFTGSSRFRSDNISNARARGLELAATGRGRFASLGSTPIGLQVRVSYTLLDTEILAVDRSQSAPPPFSVGDRLLRRPKHRFSTDVLVDSGRLTAFIQGGGRSRVRDVDPSFGTFGGLFDADGYSVWNAGAAWRVAGRLELFGRVTNLFNRAYEEVLGFPALGRGAMVGLRVAASR